MLVLWVLALLTIIAVGLTASQRTESTLAGNQLAAARFRAAADAGVTFALLNLVATPPVLDDETDIWVPDGTARPWSFAGETLEIRVFNEASRINLNTAPKDLLVALFAAVEVPNEQGNTLADAIEDWRDENDLTGLNGAEDGDYQDLGYGYGAKDGPFDSVEELQLVMGLDRDLYRTIAPAFTVDSGDAELNKEFASPLVLAALEGTTLEEAQLAQQEKAALAEAGALVEGTFGRGGPIYRIRVTRMIEDEPTLSMEALVNIESGGNPPFSLLWRRFGLGAQRQVSLADEDDLF
jgi:general secretion pathway protein K